MSRWKTENPSDNTKRMRGWLETEKGQEYRKKHAAEYMREWRKKNPHKRVAIQNRSYDKIRLECFQHYGGAFCKCCGEAEFRFLHLDHIDGNGAEKRREWRKRTKAVFGGTGFYYWLKKNGWPQEEGLQVLCANCNLGKRTGKYCPHEIRKGIDMNGNPIEQEFIAPGKYPVVVTPRHGTVLLFKYGDMEFVTPAVGAEN